ncbi:hypothetical protein [Paenibacillus abyssi]|uniref:Uncharacterized protein n=1 Tax=Paenibacillus abyssi TaxID=1340531 RepID=A0A917LGB3_9BACL|nr:hypothetical protein [Paenibacillus abyssi]GGG20666.1 hypothetical protein GCM10010916_41720 [Paenibacillus abyssi]
MVKTKDNKGRHYDEDQDYAEGVVEKNVKHPAQNNASVSVRSPK